MRTERMAGLLFACAAIASAQVGTVRNAALYSPAGSSYGNPFFNLAIFDPAIVNFNSFTGGLGYASFLVAPSFSYLPFQNSANTVSPRMLAVLTYPAVQAIATLGPAPPTPGPVTATLSIRPAGSTAATPVTVTQAVSGAITFVVPDGMPIGGAELLYRIGNQPTQWTTLNVVPSSFALFRLAPQGPAVAQTVGASGSLASVGLATPAQPGQTLRLTGSGLGNGTISGAAIGGVAAPIFYAGADSTQPGTDEILLTIPEGVPGGCYVPVTLQYSQTPILNAASTTAVTATISETAGGVPCPHPWELSVNDMKTLDAGGILATGMVNLSTQIDAVSTSVASRLDSANIQTTAPLTAGGIAGYFSPAPVFPAGQSCGPVSPSGGLIYNSGFFPSLLDLGASIKLQGPASATTFTSQNGYYSSFNPPPTDGALDNLPASAIPGGQWIWESGGGADLAASSFSFTLPRPLQLDGGAPVLLRRDRDQTVTWNGAGFDAGAIVTLSVTGNAAPPIYCVAPAAGGAITIPAALLAAYPGNSIGSLTATLNESGGFAPHAQFRLRNGNTLLVLVTYSGADYRPVVFQ